MQTDVALRLKQTHINNDEGFRWYFNLGRNLNNELKEDPMFGARVLRRWHRSRGCNIEQVHKHVKDDNDNKNGNGNGNNYDNDSFGLV